MSRFSRAFGLDGFDLAIHAGVTFSVIAFGSAFLSHGEAEAMIAAVSGASLLVLGIRRHRALRRQVPESAVELAGARMSDLESRMLEVDGLYGRVQELEERLDFAERLLAQAREPERLG